MIQSCVIPYKARNNDCLFHAHLFSVHEASVYSSPNRFRSVYCTLLLTTSLNTVLPFCSSLSPIFANSSPTSISNFCWRKSQKTRTRAIILSWIHCFPGRIQSQPFAKSRLDFSHRRQTAVGAFFSVRVIYRVPII